MIVEHILQLRGKASIDRPLAADKDYEIRAVVSVSQFRSEPQGDGNETVTYVVEPTIAEIVNDKGQRIQVKKKSKLSQVLRLKITEWSREAWPSLEDEAAYEKFMGRLLDKFEAIAGFLGK